MHARLTRNRRATILGFIEELIGAFMLPGEESCARIGDSRATQ